MYLFLLAQELLFFLAAQALGIWVVLSLAVSEHAVIPEVSEVLISPASGTISPARFLIYFVVATAILLVLFKYLRSKNVLFNVLLGIALFGGSNVVLTVMIPDPLIAFAAAFVPVILRFTVPLIWVHNIAIILSLAGIGGVFGMNFQPRDAIFVIGVLAIYDVIAVYFTKHMVTMAKKMSKTGAMFAIIIPKEISNYNKKVTQVRAGKKGFMMLGGGDLGIPLILAASVASSSAFHALLVAEFAALGLIAVHVIYISQKKSKPIPALPPIAAGALVGYIIGFFL